MKKLILVATIISIGFGAAAQDFVDNALLFSRTGPAGSARILGTGGVITALGGDYSSALSNPAGLGMYNRSEFTITPGLSLQNNTSAYFGELTDVRKDVFHLPGLSFVFHHESGQETGFLGGSFAVTMSRVNHLNRDFQYAADNSQHSMVDYFVHDAQGLTPESMLWGNSGPGSNFFTLTALAYNNYLIVDNPIGGTDYGTELAPWSDEVRTVFQKEINESTGAQTQWSISYGANFSDKVFVGAGIGLTSLRYKIRQIFDESDFRYTYIDDGTPSGYDPIDYFMTDESYDITGSGFNFTLGAIYRPVNFLQLGVSLVTPTFYGIVDRYTASVESRWRLLEDPDDPGDDHFYPSQPDLYEEFGEPLISEYRLHTPMKLNAGIAFLSKIGFISTDIELVNYSKARYRAEFAGETFSGENDAILASYKSVVNVKTGAEFRYDIYRLRAGVHYMPDPVVGDDGVKQRVCTFTAGAGIRLQSFFVDFAALFSNYEARRTPYGFGSYAHQEFNTNSFLMTFGFTF